MTDPGPFLHLFDEFPERPADLRQIVSQLILHVAWLPHYGLTPSVPLSRETLSVVERLRLITDLDRNTALRLRRPPEKRSFGTCRDYALLLCAMLRHWAIPARVRCGFATYLTVGKFEDHWICEYLLSDRWTRADAQLDDIQQAHLRVTFDCSNLPSGAFLSAAQVWSRMRSGTIRSEDCGHGEAKGAWFVRVNVHRDLLALANHYATTWDTWRNSTPSSKFLTASEFEEIDQLVKAIEEVEGGTLSGEPLEAMVRKLEPPPWQM
jgi:hypothetical protein